MTSSAITSTPSIRTRPAVGSMRRLTIFSVVVLPQPDGPTRMQIRPAGTVRLKVVDRAGHPLALGRPVVAPS